MRDAKQRVRFRFSVVMEREVPAEWDEDMVRFYFEENHCNDNHVNDLKSWADRHPGICRICNHSEVEVLEFGLPLVPMDGPWPEQ